MFSIGQVSQMFDLPISTLRYYDNEGLFPNLQRISGVRKFDDSTIATLHLIECLKQSGLEIKDIKQFIEWTQQGPSTYQKRLDLLQKQKEQVDIEMKKLKKTQAMLEFKCWYYQTAINDGNEARIHDMLPNRLPKDIQALYDEAHNDD